MNRLLHSADDVKEISVGQPAAMGYMRSVLTDGIESADFLVIDNALDSSGQDALTRVALTSTFWFDVTNGGAFVAHSDDGMTQSLFYDFGQVRIVYSIIWGN